MALVSWSDTYSVGVKILDDQHKGLIALLNEMHAAMMQGQAQRAAGPLLKKLLDYTRVHFAAEERLMSQSRYAGLAEHRARHQDLSSRVAEFVARKQKDDPAMYLPMLNFLRDWLTTHIQKEDKAFGPWVNAQGIR